MRIVSVNVGRPREIRWRGDVVTTSIFKDPVAGRVVVDRLNLAGDQQSDLTVHGGAEKAVYVFPSEHYAFWQKELAGIALAWGAFGENLTTEGLHEDAMCIGDRLRIGSADFTVTQPRMPCFKLAIRFDRPDIVKRFLRSGRTGFYLSVAEEGAVAAGDSVNVTAHADDGMCVADIVRLYTAKRPDQDLLRRASELSALSAGWRDYFRKRLQERDV
jgi:MOSC domain-containing protein YiiM